MTIYDVLIKYMEQKYIPFSTIDHEPEGNTVKASVLRGHSLEEAAKSMVTIIENSSGRGQYVLAVVGGAHKINMKRLARVFGGKRASFATFENAERLTRCEMGAVPPISFDVELSTIFDQNLLSIPEIIFNAGRLDRSVRVNTSAFVNASMPVVSSIAGTAIAIAK